MDKLTLDYPKLTLVVSKEVSIVPSDSCVAVVVLVGSNWGRWLTRQCLHNSPIPKDYQSNLLRRIRDCVRGFAEVDLLTVASTVDFAALP